MITIIIWIINAKPITYSDQWKFLHDLTQKKARELQATLKSA
jgi:hypothetical protein